MKKKKFIKLKIKNLNEKIIDISHCSINRLKLKYKLLNDPVGIIQHIILTLK